MSAPVSRPPLQPGFSSASEPPLPTEEIELKFNVRSERSLDRLRDAIIRYDLHSREFWHLNPEIFYQRQDGHAGVLYTHPVSWYIDDAQLHLLDSHANLRTRLTQGIENYYEWGVKGKARSFDGPGSAIRHEHEITTNTLAIPVSELLENPTTHELLAPAMGHPLYYIFASDVPRDVIGFPTMVDGKKALFEVCFDHIRYVRPSGENIAEERDIRDIQGTEFHKLNQIEIEYFHPDHKDPELREMAKKLGLETLTKPEIEQAIHDISDSVQSIARHIGVRMTPTTVSKARTGFDARFNREMELSQPLGIPAGIILG